MTLKVNEVGVLFRSALYFDVSTYDSFSITLIDPNGDETVIPDGRITVGSTDVTDPTLGELTAFTYLEFNTESTDFPLEGTWKDYPTANRTSPEAVRYGDCASFPIEAICPS